MGGGGGGAVEVGAVDTLSLGEACLSTWTLGRRKKTLSGQIY